MVWGIYIAIYLFMAGAGAGAFLTAVVTELYSRVRFMALIRSGLIISGPMVALGMPFLMLDLGIGKYQPWRLIYLYLGNPGSIMTWGVWILSTFILVALLLASFEVEDVHWPVIGQVRWPWSGLKRFRRRIMAFGALLAFATSVYTGLLLGVVAGVPLWNTTILPALFLISALSTGMAAAVVFAVLSPAEERRLMAAHFFYLNQVHSLLILAELIFICCWLFITANGSITAAQSVSTLLSGSLAIPFWIGVVFFGIIDPLLIYVYEVILHKPLMPYAMVISDGSVLVGGFVLRYVALGAAVPILLS